MNVGKTLTGPDALHILRWSPWEKVPMLPALAAAASTSGEEPAGNSKQCYDFEPDPTDHA